MNAIRDILVCLNCDVGVYTRVHNEAISCECGCVTRNKNENIISCDGEPIKGVHYEFHEKVELRVSEQKLEEDYFEMHDKLGTIRNAKKAIAAIIKMKGVSIIGKKPDPYIDYSDIVEYDIEYRLKLKEKDLAKFK